MEMNKREKEEIDDLIRRSLDSTPMPPSDHKQQMMDKFHKHNANKMTDRRMWEISGVCAFVTFAATVTVIVMIFFPGQQKSDANSTEAVISVLEGYQDIEDDELIVYDDWHDLGSLVAVSCDSIGNHKNPNCL